MTTTALSKVKPPRDGLLYDSQWVNIVNHDNAYRGWDVEEAVNHAVKATLAAVKSNIESALASAEPVAGLSLRFGMGAWVVNTGTHDGEPCVFIDDAPKPGKVGERAEPVREGTTPRLRLLFPTDDQCVRVADALVNAPLSPSAAHMRDLADMLDPEKQAYVLRAAADALPAAKVEAPDLVLQLLVAGGFVDPAKVEQAREIIAGCAPTPASVPDGCLPAASIPYGWIDIYSIPKDGRRVELLAANGKRDVGNYYHFDDPSFGFMEHLNTDGGHGDYTHWRPLKESEPTP